MSGQLGHSSRLAHIQDADSGLDSPTYDGDVESTMPSSSSKSQHPSTSSTTTRPNAIVDEGESTASSISLGPNVTAPASPVSSTYPDPPSSIISLGSHDAEFSPVSADEGISIPLLSANRRSAGDVNTLATFLVPTQPSLNLQKGTPKAGDVGLPTLEPTAPADVKRSDHAPSNHATEDPINTSDLTPDDIRTFVQRAITGEEHRKYKINSPPTDRPVRIYADGMGHFWK